MQYRYVALDKERRLVQGELEATSDRTAEDHLLQNGLRVISIQTSRQRTNMRRFLPVTSTVNRKDVILFSQQLATILNAGVPLLSAIQLLRDEARGQAFKTVLGKLVADLQEGESFHGALSKAPKVFPQLFVSMVDAGERSGTLELVLRHLASYLQREMTMKQQLKKALMYPAIVAVVGIVVVGVLVTVVLPSLAELLSGLGGDLPFLTRVILGFSDVVQAWKLQGLLFIAGSIALGAWRLRKPAGRRQLDRLLLRLPLLGRLVLQQNLARFSRTASLLQGAGLSITEALTLAEETASNRIIREAISGARSKVIEGSSLAEALRSAPLMPGLFVQMVKVGEEGGALESNLASMADFYEREVEDQLATLISLLEPAMTLVMGVAVALIALSVLLPMFSLMDSIGTQP